MGCTTWRVVRKILYLKKILLIYKYGVEILLKNHANKKDDKFIQCTLLVHRKKIVYFSSSMKNQESRNAKLDWLFNVIHAGMIMKIDLV